MCHWHVSLRVQVFSTRKVKIWSYLLFISRLEPGAAVFRYVHRRIIWLSNRVLRLHLYIIQSWGYNSQLIVPTLYMLFPRISKINFSNRTSFYQMRCIKITHCINDGIKNVGYEKFSWSWKFKIIFKYLRCWIDVFYCKILASLSRNTQVSFRSSYHPTRENIISYHSSSPLNTICMPFYFILQLGFAGRILKEKTIKISMNYMRPKRQLHYIVWCRDSLGKYWNTGKSLCK